MRPIALLAWWQLWNAIRTTLTQPRKLIPLIVMVFAIGFQVFIQIMVGPMTHSMRGMPYEPAEDVLAPAFVHACAVFILALSGLGAMGMGLQGASLQFSPGDADYLFPSPLPRRLVLAYRIPAMLAQPLFFSFMLSIFGRTVFRGPLGAAGIPAPSGMGLFAGLFLCLAIYQQAGLMCHLFVKADARTRIGHVLTGIALLLSGLGAGAYAQHGMDGVAAAGGNPLLLAACAPCALAANAILGGPFTQSFAPLLTLFAASIAAVFIRESNYYETAVVNVERVVKVRDAVKSGDFGAAYRMKRTQAKRGIGKRAYTIPPFGRGSGAILWAHLAAACKTPFMSIYAPFLGGMALAGGALFFSPQNAAYISAGGDAYFVMFLVQITGKGVCRRAIQLQQTIRPLPLAPAYVVAADIAPATLTMSLFGWGAALPLLVTGGGQSTLVALMFLLVGPSVVFSVLLMQYLLTFWYPSAQDKLQQMISNFIGLLLTGIHFGVLAPTLIFPTIFHAPMWLTLGLGLVVSLGMTMLWFAVAVRAYARYQPQEGG